MHALPQTPAAELIDFPHGTVSGVIDHEEGVLRLFSDTQPHPEDRALSLALATQLAGGGWTLYGCQDVNMLEIQIIPVVLPVVA